MGFSAVAVAFLGLVAGDAAQVFGEVSPAVFQIVVEHDGKVHTSGTGFFVSRSGLALTAYHVVRGAFVGGDTYTVTAVSEAGRTPVRVLDVDPVTDLALLELAPSAAHHYLGDVRVDPPIGTTIYGVGRPGDSGMTIVQGTVRGVEDGDKISLGVALAPGMSGGPTVDAEGAVIGINVSQGPNMVGHIAPIRAAMRLVLGYQRSAPASAAERMRARMSADAERALARVETSTGVAMVRSFRVPSVGCDDVTSKAVDDLSVDFRPCVWRRSLDLTKTFRIGGLSVEYAVFTQFAGLAPRLWMWLNLNAPLPLPPAQDGLTGPLACESTVTTLGALPARVELCSRELRVLPGLREYFFTAITHDAGRDVLVIRARSSAVEPWVARALFSTIASRVERVSARTVP